MRQDSSQDNFRPLSPYLAWPTFAAVQPFSLRAMTYGLEFSQWDDADVLKSGQQAQLRLLLGWATGHVPYYRKTPEYAAALASLRQRPSNFPDCWARLPILTKAQLREFGASLRASSLPPGHGPVEKARTSGSTGIPVEVGTTTLTRTLWDALTIRDHLWHRRDFRKRLGVIRILKDPQRVPGGVSLPSWGSPVNSLFSTGASAAIHVGRPLHELVEWLERFDPHYLLTYPSVAAALLDEFGRRRPKSLEEFRLFAEPTDPELVQRLQSEWNVQCTDIYTASELGYIAIQCPECRKLHVQSEGVHVEILDDSGDPCRVGQTGRVVVTSLHNFATPLIRYDLGDFATVGQLCGCKRSSLVLERVLGRVRNMVRLPDGQRFYPTGMTRVRRLAFVRQAQYVQTSLTSVELRVVLDHPLTDEEAAQAVAFVRKVLNYPFDVHVVAVDRIERGPTGKFEEFVSLVADN